jgi:hypothetical protein
MMVTFLVNKRRQDREQAAATAPKPAVPEADIELFIALLKATDGHVVRHQPPGTGIKNIDVVKSMLANGADLEQDILPVLRRHADELAQRPLESWTAPWFVEEVTQSHRQRVTAAQKPAAQPIGDEELLTKLHDAAGGNVMTNNSIMFDLTPIRAILADDGVALDDILRALREKVNRGVNKYAATLKSWGEPRFLRHVALAYLSRTVVPAMVETWTKIAKSAGAPGMPVQKECCYYQLLHALEPTLPVSHVTLSIESEAKVAV